MKIGGLQKCSFLDFPRKISAIVFTQGCNFRCPFCHNSQLVFPENFEQNIPESEILDFLNIRKKQLDGVVITGGEPTLQQDLIPFIKKIKALGFAVKLDTNGSNVDVIVDCVNQHLLDYIAMDIKHSGENYSSACGVQCDMDQIKQSIKFIKISGIDYEFRTTVVPSIHKFENMTGIADLVKGAKLFALQKFIPDHAAQVKLRQENSPSDDEMLNLKSYFEKFVDEVIVR